MKNKLRSFLSSIGDSDVSANEHDTSPHPPINSETGESDTDAISLYSGKVTRDNLVRQSSDMSGFSETTSDFSAISDFSDFKGPHGPSTHHNTKHNRKRSLPKRSAKSNGALKPPSSHVTFHNPSFSKKSPHSNANFENLGEGFNTLTDDLGLNPYASDSNLTSLPKPPPSFTNATRDLDSKAVHNRIQVNSPNAPSPLQMNYMQTHDNRLDRLEEAEFSPVRLMNEKSERKDGSGMLDLFRVGKEINLRGVHGRSTEELFNNAEVDPLEAETLEIHGIESESVYYYSYDTDATDRTEKTTDSFEDVLMHLQALKVKHQPQKTQKSKLEKIPRVENLIDAHEAALEDEENEEEIVIKKSKKKIPPVETSESSTKAEKVEKSDKSEMIKKKKKSKSQDEEEKSEKKNKKEKKVKAVKSVKLEKGQSQSKLLDLDDLSDGSHKEEAEEDDKEEKAVKTVKKSKKKSKASKKDKKNKKDKKKKTDRKAKKKTKRRSLSEDSAKESDADLSGFSDAEVKEIDLEADLSTPTEKKPATKEHLSLQRRKQRLSELKRIADEEDALDNPMELPSEASGDENANEGQAPLEEGPEPQIGIQYDPERQITLGDPIKVGTSVWAVDFAYDRKFRRAKVVAFTEPATYTVKFGMFRKQPGTQRLDIALKQPRSRKSRKGFGSLFSGSKDVFKCAESGDVQGVLDAILKNADVVDKKGGKQNKTALYYAAKNGKDEVVKLLLRYGAEDDEQGSVLQDCDESTREVLLGFGWGRVGAEA